MNFICKPRQEGKTEALRQAGLIPPCPWCQPHTNASVQTGSQPRSFYCRRCRREFEDVDDGTTGYGGPLKYAMRKENYKKHA